jgi:hypothetical protein
MSVDTLVARRLGMTTSTADHTRSTSTCDRPATKQSPPPPWFLRAVVVLTAIALVCVLPSLTGCTRSGGNGSASGGSGQAAPAPAHLTDAETRYGVSPTRNSQVTYQDDVIVMEHGAEAIRSQAPNGLTWTIDASAPGARDIQPGKILFATGRVVGRVLAVEARGNEVAVTLGPMELTDVIKEADISYQGPLDLDKMIPYMAPEYPGTFTDLDAAKEQTSELRRRSEQPVQLATFSPSGEPRIRAISAAYRSTRIGESSNGTSAGLPSDIPISGFHFFPDLSQGLGFSATHHTREMDFTAFAKLRLDHPNFAFRLKITSSGLQTAQIQLGGLAGVRVGFKGGTNGDFKNPNQAFELPLDISFPIPGIPVPFAATFHQSILVTTMFTARNATLDTTGEYAFSGTITAGVVNGQLGATAPIFVATKQNLVNSLSGVSVGVNGLVLGYGGKFIVGLGGWGLAVGPYLSANTTVGVTRGSDAQTGLVGFTCRSAQYEMYLDYGVGYAIPNTVVEALNSFLSLFHVKKINATHGTSLGRVPIKTNSEGLPPSCAA